jgi:hypothetical protein
MNNEELIKENMLLREENDKLKKQLYNYNNSINSYEKNTELYGVNLQKCNILLKQNEDILSTWDTITKSVKLEGITHSKTRICLKNKNKIKPQEKTNYL